MQFYLLLLNKLKVSKVDMLYTGYKSFMFLNIYIKASQNLEKKNEQSKTFLKFFLITIGMTTKIMNLETVY